MKSFLLFSISFFIFIHGRAQNQVNSLPTGKYETMIKNKQDKWAKGDIILLDDSKYKISTSDEMGEYRFSTVAQRIFFISGPLKSMFAKTSLNDQEPVIVIPVAENEELGLKLPSEVWCYYRH